MPLAREDTDHTPDNIVEAYARFGLNPAALVAKALAVTFYVEDNGSCLGALNVMIVRLADEGIDRSFFAQQEVLSLKNIVEKSLQQIQAGKSSILSDEVAKKIQSHGDDTKAWYTKDITDLNKMDLSQISLLKNFIRLRFLEVLALREILIATKKFTLSPDEVSAAMAKQVCTEFSQATVITTPTPTEIAMAVQRGLEAEIPGFQARIFKVLGDFKIQVPKPKPPSAAANGAPATDDPKP